MLLKAGDQDFRDFIGKIVLSLNDYEDQLNHEESICLYNRKNKLTKINIEMNIKWFYSKEKYFIDGIENWGYKIEMEEKNLKEIQEDLRILYEPLGKLEGKSLGERVENKKKLAVFNQTNDLEKQFNYLKYFLYFFMTVTALSCIHRPSFLDVFCYFFLFKLFINFLHKKS